MYKATHQRQAIEEEGGVLSCSGTRRRCVRYPLRFGVGEPSERGKRTARMAGMAALQGAMEPLSIFLCPARRAPPASGATCSLPTPRHKLGFVAVASQLRFSLLLQCFGKLLVILGTLESGALLNIVEYNYFLFLFESGAPQAYVLN